MVRILNIILVIHKYIFINSNICVFYYRRTHTLLMLNILTQMIGRSSGYLMGMVVERLQSIVMNITSRFYIVSGNILKKMTKKNG